MATETEAQGKGRKRKQRYLPHNKPVKKKGSHPLRPGVEGFFITCDGGRERQAAHEALSVIDSFFDELVNGKDASADQVEVAPSKVLNRKIKFTYSDSSDGEGDADDDENDSNDGNDNVVANEKNDKKSENPADGDGVDKSDLKEEETQAKENTHEKEQEVEQHDGDKSDEVEGRPVKKQCCESGSDNRYKAEKSVDKLIEAELEELADKNKRRFLNLESGCNGVAFIRMKKRDGDPGPKEIVQHMMESAASTRKHMSRHLLRILPVEVACYASEEEISRAIKPIIDKYFPVEGENAVKFAVLYDARANSGIDRMKIIDAVAKSVPKPHKVNLKDPEKSIVVQIVKTVCLIGVVEKYKQLAKYNLRQLTSSKP